MKLRPIAIYLPQYHPIPENDEWWGKGFTEWTNVTKATPLYKGHYQPQLPTDLGFYDLRLPEARQAQADLAKQYGIHGFCYYHYWFNGRRILERPFQEVFESGKPDFPFMLCWANENWTRVWDGGENKILLKQNYSEQDDANHIRTLIPYFKDARYIKVDGKPVFSIYRSTEMPNIKRTIEIWRQEAKREGLELYICRFENHGALGAQYLEAGFDASIDFPPYGNTRDKYSSNETKKKSLAARIISHLKFKYGNPFNRNKSIMTHLYNWIDYEEYVNFILETSAEDYKCFPGITPCWDNSARKRKNFFIMKNSSPEYYKKWLSHIVKNFPSAFKSKDENFIFINAWNEWAEGNHLEPCIKWGRGYLDATKSVIEG
ncbi:MAG TPA: glycoside hydrolase family 99-like domain-containing protein [Flavipsychrobacter sp.]|nr:glycoside hydrolase family 99-like domain-containing protein [Flavipsychrobacter sp.]